MSNSSSHFAPLTWLRGIAAMLVIVSHTLRSLQDTYVTNAEPVNWLWLRVFDLGTFGVLLFFTLSGTTLYLSFTNREQKLDVTVFYLKRFFRIWPAFFVALVVYILFSLVFNSFYSVEPTGAWVEKQFLTDYTLVDVLTYLTLSFNILGTSGLFNNAFWSLPVEFQYYLLFPLIIFGMKYLSFMSPILMAAVLYGIFKLDLGWFNDGRFFMLGFTFSGGVFLGILYRYQRQQIKGIVGTLIFVLLFCTASIFSNGFISIPDLPVISNVWVMLGLLAMGMVATILLFDVSIGKKLESMFFKFGEISYSAYLYHNLFIAIAVLILIQFNIVGEFQRFIVVFILGSIISTFIAAASYKHIEIKFMKFGNELIKKKLSKGR